MYKARNLIVTLAVLAMLPMAAGSAYAMQHMDHEKSMDHGGMKMDHDGMKMDHGGMDMHGDMIMLGDAEQDGVKAMAHLKDVKAEMSKMGMKTTHHLMVMFAGLDDGKPIDSGSAAVKYTGPDGVEHGPVKLMGMQGHFGADVELGSPGAYHFNIGTKLADGKKRQYEFDFDLK